MESLKIINIEKFTESGECWISVKIHDKKENIYFWIDCSLIDGFGNHRIFKTDDLFVDWDWNQYIFNLENTQDIQAKKYQENYNNIDKIQFLIDENNDYLVNILKNMEVK